MTLTTTSPRVSYAGDNSTIIFAVPFYFLANSHIVVILRSSAGVETTWVENTQYALTGAGVAAGGTLTVDTSPTDYTPLTGQTLVIRRVAPYTQETDYPEGGDFPARAHEDALDKATMLTQQLAEFDVRALHYPATDSASLSSEIPNSTDRASKYLGFTAAGVPTALAAPTTTSITTAFSQTLLDDPDAATARATLAAAGTGVVNTFTATQSWAKGADITSAATLVLGTDGNFFDVAGSTGPITAITVPAGTLFMLQFDSTPTLTHHATNLNLPSGANIVAAAGDRLIGFATAANTVHVVAYIRATGGSLINDFLHYQDQATSGTDGPTYTADSWQTVPLDTEVEDTAGIGSLAANAITLAAGSYEFVAFMSLGAATATVLEARMRLRNTTDGSTVAQGVNYSQAAAMGSLSLFVQGRFTIATSKVFEIQVYPNESNNTTNLAVSSGEVEVYADIQFRRYAA